jgi:NADPH-dependent 2,4-dienoyl-CoA reductase/sulfur reductase-like enzyme
MPRTELSCDVLVIGGGPAGIAACVSAAKTGARVILVDDNPLPGGQIWRAAETEAVQPGNAGLWLRRLRGSGAEVLSCTRVVALLAQHTALAESDSAAIEINFGSAILATGARELLLPFPGWTLPNVFAAGGLQALVKSGLAVEDKRIVVAGTGPLLLAVAAYLKSKGARIEGVFEQSPLSRVVGFGASLVKRPSMLWAAAHYGSAIGAGNFHCGWWPISAEGIGEVRSLTVTDGTRRRTLPCDMVACGFHLVPNTELQSVFGCAIADDRVRVNEWQATSIDHVYSVGESTGVGGLELALVEGQIAGFAVSGKKEEAKRLFGKRQALNATARAMDRAFALRPELRRLAREDTIVCRCEDVRWSALQDQHSWRAAKLYTRCGMGPCQGRICGAALQFLSGWRNESTRPPVYPVRLSTLVREPQIAKEKP